MNQSVKVYRSSVKPDMYLFVAEREELTRVPPELMKRFGRPIEAMSLDVRLPPSELAHNKTSTRNQYSVGASVTG